MVRGFSRNHGLEDQSVADFLEPANRALLLESSYNGLDGGVSGPALLGEPLLNLAHRTAADVPKRVHDFKLKLCQLLLRLSSHDIPRTFPRLLQVRLKLLQLS